MKLAALALGAHTCTFEGKVSATFGVDRKLQAHRGGPKPSIRCSFDVRKSPTCWGDRGYKVAKVRQRAPLGDKGAAHEFSPVCPCFYGSYAPAFHRRMGGQPLRFSPCHYS